MSDLCRLALFALEQHPFTSLSIAVRLTCVIPAFKGLALCFAQFDNLDSSHLASLAYFCMGTYNLERAAISRSWATTHQTRPTRC